MKLCLLAFALLSVVPALAQRAAPADRSELEAIERRGRLLYEYDRAAWQATDALLATNPPRERLGMYLARKSGDRWSVAFGRLSESREAFEISYLATQDSSPTAFSVKAYEPALSDTGFYASAARAIGLTREEFTGEWERYNVAVLPTDSAHLYVYFLPAQIEAKAFPLGSDTRYRVSEDGERILDKRQMHNAVIVFPPESARDSVTIQTGVHSAVIDEAPEDSDVFHVLARTPSVDELIITRRWVYGIKASGRVSYLMPIERFRDMSK